MRFVIYKNSVLATICSLFGAAFIVLAVRSMICGELGILPGIGVIAAGLGLMWLGDLISTKKAERKQKKAQQAAAEASVSTASCAQPQQAASTASNAAPAASYAASTASNVAPAASYAAPAAQGRPVNGSAVFAGIFFLLATLLGLWSVFSPYNNYLDRLAIVECAGFLLLAIGCFWMKRTQLANAFHLIGALLPAMSCAYSVFNLLRLDRHAAAPILKMSLITLALVLAAYLLMLLFAFCAMKPRGSGGVTGALWFLPSVLLTAYLVIQFYYDINLNRLLNDFVENPRWMPYPIMLMLFRDIHVIVACLLAGLCFRRICRCPAAVPPLNTPCDQFQYVPPVQPVQPQPEPRHAAPEPPKQPEAAPKANDQDMEKQIQAYKDLLDCGILTQEECEQKIHELMQKHYGG